MPQRPSGCLPVQLEARRHTGACRRAFWNGGLRFRHSKLVRMTCRQSKDHYIVTATSFTLPGVNRPTFPQFMAFSRRPEKRLFPSNYKKTIGLKAFERVTNLQLLFPIRLG